MTTARQAAIAQRLVLAFLSEDEDAHDIAVGEISDCPGCWRSIAQYLVAELAGVIQNELGDTAITRTENELAWLLDLDEADR